MVNTEFSAIVPAPFGAIGIITSDDFLLGVELFSHKMLDNSTVEKPAADAFTHSIVNQIKAYLADPKATLYGPYALQGTPYQKRVWHVIASIPSGQVLTYTQLADKVSSGPRAVANVCGANNIPLFIPCHRVVAKNSLGGFMQGEASGLTIKQWLLKHEGAVL